MGKKASGTLIIYAIIFLFSAVFILLFKIIIVSGFSMAPTFHDGQLVLVYKVASSYQYDDVIVLKNDDSLMVKRIIGLPGDVISLRGGEVRRNGVILEPYECDKALDTLINLECNELFVIGDNYKDSIDSRSFGPVDQGEVMGKVVLNLRAVFPRLKALYQN